jgi:hypothetical protein
MVREKYSCDCNVIHIGAVRAVLDRMPSEDVLFQVSEYFRVSGRPDARKNHMGAA